MFRQRQLLSFFYVCLGFVACRPAAPVDDGASAEKTALAPTKGGDEAANPFRTVEIKSAGPAEADKDVSTRYEIRLPDAVLEEIRKADEAANEARNQETSEIRKRQKDRKEKEKLEKQTLVSSLAEEKRPTSIGQFQVVLPHRPPAPQYFTGTCWSFAATSFMESETQRISGNEIKLSEMATVYAEYLAKATRFIGERGDSLFVEGSEINAIARIWKEYGAIPLDAYAGVTAKDGRHNHPKMLDEMTAMLNSFKATDMWDLPTALSTIRIVLDKHLGPRPASFEFKGKTYDPIAFLKEVLRIDTDAYVDFMSTLSFPFYKRGELKVADNWWHADNYHNLPLEEFYAAFKGAVKSGFSAAVAIDVSEPGVDSVNDVMFIPDYDIPAGHIDQLSREYRIASEITTDDHGIHVVGVTEFAGHDWFLAKDSGRGARRGKIEGYYFIRDDYIRLKMLAFTVHRSAVADLMSKF